MQRSSLTGTTDRLGPRRVIGVFSVLLNLALVAVLTHLLGNQQQEDFAAGSLIPAPAAAGKVNRSPSQRHPPAAASPAFDWNRLVSTNFVVYAENLRTVECPERIIREIILPLIEESFTDQKAAIQAAMPFWQTGSERELAERDQARLFASLDKERLNLVRQALGFEWNTEALNTCDEEEVGMLMSFLPQDRLERSFCILANFGKEIEATHDQSLGVVTPEDCALRRELYNQAVSAVSADDQLGLAGYTEALLRILHLMSTILRSSAANGFEISGAELRQWTQIKSEDCFPVAAELLKDDPDIREQAEQGEILALSHLRRLIGDERFVKYLKSEDAHFGQLADVSEEKGLPLDRLMAAFELMQSTQTEANQIHQQPDLKSSERKRELESLRQASAETLAGIIGERPDADVIRTNAPWLSDLSK